MLTFEHPRPLCSWFAFMSILLLCIIGSLFAVRRSQVRSGPPTCCVEPVADLRPSHPLCCA
jgi:hypothetical protein